MLEFFPMVSSAYSFLICCYTTGNDKRLLNRIYIVAHSSYETHLEL